MTCGERIGNLERFMDRAIAQFPSLGEPLDSLVCKAVPITDAPGDDTRDAALAQMEVSVANAEAWAKYAERDRVVLIDRVDELEKEVKFRIEQLLRMKARVETFETFITRKRDLKRASCFTKDGCYESTDGCLQVPKCKSRDDMEEFNRLLAGTGEFAPKENA